MQYKTMILELLQQRPLMHEGLRKEKKLLAALERHARQLRANHLTWKERLARTRTRNTPAQINSEALELALKDMVDYLDCEFPPSDAHDPLCLDAAMDFIRRRMPRG